jgi:DNA adenine methylase
MSDARPPIKWAGGKTKSLPELLRFVPEKIHTYVEPFVGGGALFFELAKQRRFKHAILNDKNEELMNAYVEIWRSLPALLVVLERHAKQWAARTIEGRAEYFYEVRAQDPKELNDVHRAARFIFLNKTCFNGLYRVNQAGKFNTPVGRYANPTICDVENLRAVSEVFKAIKIEFWRSDFGACIGVGDFTYCDPPYDVLNENADFTGYTAGGFTWADQERLEMVAYASAKRPGTKVVLSNADTPRVRKLYSKWSIHDVKAERTINSKADRRGKITELVITP